MKKTYRVLIAEDEQLIAENLSGKITRLSSRFEVAGIAPDGKKALASLKETPVDVLITDVRMPLMDGLALAAEARRLYKELPIVILSGYADFTYVQKAIPIGITAYLLKPVKEQNLTDVLEQIATKLDSIQQLNTQRYLRQMILGHKQTENGYDDQPVSFSYLSFGNLCTVMPSHTTVSIYENLWEKVHKEGLLQPLAPFELVEDIYPTGRFLLSSASLNAAQWEDVRAACETALSVRADLFYYDKPVPIHQLHENASQMKFAQKRFSSYTRGVLINMNDLPDTEPAISREAATLLPLAQFIPSCTEGGMPQTVFTELLGKRLRRQFDHHPFITEAEYLHTLYELMDKLSQPLTGEEMKSAVLNTFSLLLLEEGEPKEGSSKLVQAVCRYIRAHYAEEITLETISLQFRFAASHIIKVFKQTLNDTPIHFLITVRMAEAKRLLLHTDMDIKEVSLRVGYVDQHYFSRMFKNIEGVSPSTFREQ